MHIEIIVWINSFITLAAGETVIFYLYFETS